MTSFIPSFAVVSLIIFSIILGDYFLTPYFSQNINNNTTLPTANHNKTKEVEVETPKPTATVSPLSTNTEKPSVILTSSDIFTNELAVHKITNISALPKYQNSFLFQKFPINKTDHNISITTTEYRENNINNTSVQSEYMKIHEFNIYEQSLENAYKKIQKNIKFQLRNNPEAKIVEVNQYGEKSFVIRLESNQKTMYLVIESKGRLLGIEYHLGENFSRHRDLNKVLKTLFPLSQ